jgi:hypothetical protein
MNLKIQEKVLFCEAEHTYTMGDKQLSGVTTMLKEMLFQDKYSGISEEILKKASEYGTSVHKGVEALIMCEKDNAETPEEKNFLKMAKKMGIIPLVSEYLVSDEQHIASSIDIVAQGKKGEIVLADIKTTYGGLDKDYLSWQLSTYAYLFELQNPELKVDKLYGIWLRKKESDYAEIKRIPSEVILQLISDYVAGIPTMLTASNLPMEVINLADIIKSKMEMQKKIAEEVEQMKMQMLDTMKANGIEKIDLQDKVLITYIAPTERESLDSKKIKDNHPELYAMYLKKSSVKESIKITLR